MKKTFRTWLSIALIPLWGCSTTKTVNTPSTATSEATPSQQETNASQVAYEQRMKEARKPCGFISVGYMDVIEGQEQAYLEIEGQWHQIHEHLVSEGKIISWGLAKARANDFGYEYITWKLVRSLADLEQPYDWESIGAWMGKEKLAALLEKTPQTRSISGQEVLALEDYTLPSLDTPPQALDAKNMSFHWDFMTPAEGKAEAYAAVERSVFLPMHQKRQEIQPGNLFWNLQRQVFHTGKANPALFRTVNAFRNDIPEPSPEAQQQINAQIPPYPEGMTYADVQKLRSMKRVTFDVIYRIDENLSAEAKTRAALLGTWTHTNPNGSYRTKVMTPFAEQLSFYRADGTLIQKRDPIPFQVSVSGQDKKFTAFFANGGTWTASFDIKNGLWYEQQQGLLKDGTLTDIAPDAYWIYQRGKTPEKRRDGKQTMAGKEVDLIKSMITHYTQGDFDAYRACYTDDAKIVHNDWGFKKGISVDELMKQDREHHAELERDIEVLKSIYEVVTLPNGSKHGHVWVEMKNTYKNGHVSIIPVFLSLGINKENKIWYEWAFYDTSLLPQASPYREP
jgi:hypothetical protein